MKNILKFNLNLKTYPLEVIYQACYVFLDRAYIFLDSSSSQKIEVTIKGKEKLSQKQEEALKGDFYNELLNSSLRVQVNKENKKIIETIIGRALFSALGEKMGKGKNKLDFEKDKLGIAVPWEDKYQEENKTRKTKKKNKTKN